MADVNSATRNDCEDNVVMGDVISLMNCFQDLASTAKIPLTAFDLPQMVVVGEQSAGKSSVLENIVGKDFLPRGPQLVTRCPIVLQLILQPGVEYAEFLHLQSKKFTNFDEVKKEIQLQTEKLTGAQDTFSKQSINLKIYSPNVPHLTLVDLPGIVKVNVGSQPGDIEQIVTDMILDYIQPENAIILAVTQGGQDIASSDAIKIARKVDPKGLRTIGIITKLDLMDPGTDARRILDNQVVVLKRGFIGVVNRSQKDLDKKKDIKSAREMERRFFDCRSAYKDIAHRMGSEYLSESLSVQLCAHIRDKLPTMQTQFEKEHSRVKQKLKAMKAFEHRQDAFWQNHEVVQLVQKFNRDLDQDIAGQSKRIDHTKKGTGNKIINCFYTHVYPRLIVQFEVCNEELTTLWENINGYRNTMFFAQLAFENVVGRYLQRFKDRLKIVTAICAEVVKNAIMSSSKRFHVYPELKREVLRLMMEELARNEKVTKDQLIFYIKAQKSFMNICHPDFMKQFNLKKRSEEAKKRFQNASETSTTTTTTSQSSTTENKTEETIVKTGSMQVHSVPEAKPFFFVLTSEKLIWYSNKVDVQPQGSIPVDKLAIKASRGEDATQKYLICTKDRSSHSPSVLISFQDEKEEKDWVDHFGLVGVKTVPEDGTSADNNSVITDGQNQQDQQEDIFGLTELINMDDMINDPRRKFNYGPILEEVTWMLTSYAEILQENIHDMTPKFVTYALIHKTLKYANFELLADVQKKGCDELLKMSDEVMSKRAEYFKLYETTGKALKIMSDVARGHIKLKNVNAKNNEEWDTLNSEDEHYLNGTSGIISKNN